MSENTMLGRRCPEGPGGRACPCCGQAPGSERIIKKRALKRREKQRTQREIRRELAG